MSCSLNRFAAPFLALALPLAAQVDLGLIQRIKVEAFDHSRVMDTLSLLSDAHGGRLTGSPEFREAADWAKARLEAFGISKVHEEAWGPFGRSWSVREQSLEMLAPRYARLIAAPLAWSDATPGPVTGEVVFAPTKASGRDVLDPGAYRSLFEAYRKAWTGKLRGKIVLLRKENDLKDALKAPFSRYTDAELAEMAGAPAPVAKPPLDLEHLVIPDDPDEAWKLIRQLPYSVLSKRRAQFREVDAARNAFLRSEGALAVLTTDERCVRGQVAAEAAGQQKAEFPLPLPTFAVTGEAYNRMIRLLKAGTPVKLRVDLATECGDKDQDAINIVGEIPGGKKADEVVMIGAHFDSWHSGTGATDNGAGTAVMMEVMRVLKALDLHLDRTVRLGLWSGEEQGLLGSRAYVKAHFGDPADLKPTAEHARLSGYYNLDNGTGKIRGVYLQGNDALRPIFAEWLAPFGDMGARTVTLRDTGGTDHQSFDAVGLPGFQFIQDPLDYGSTTHHTSNDTFDHCKAEDLMQATAIITAFVVQTANRPGLLPRKAMPKPEGAPSSLP